MLVVVLPQPPFWLMMAIVRIGKPSLAWQPLGSRGHRHSRSFGHAQVYSESGEPIFPPLTSGT
jgi:hypothetical protein